MKIFLFHQGKELNTDLFWMWFEESKVQTDLHQTPHFLMMTVIGDADDRDPGFLDEFWEELNPKVICFHSVNLVHDYCHLLPRQISLICYSENCLLQRVHISAVRWVLLKNMITSILCNYRSCCGLANTRRTSYETCSLLFLYGFSEEKPITKLGDLFLITNDLFCIFGSEFGGPEGASFWCFVYPDSLYLFWLWIFSFIWKQPFPKLYLFLL